MLNAKALRKLKLCIDSPPVRSGKDSLHCFQDFLLTLNLSTRGQQANTHETSEGLSCTRTLGGSLSSPQAIGELDVAPEIFFRGVEYLPLFIDSS